ncbi:MAG: glycosyltransferase family 4 protein [Lachnospiraceae bacterium]|nr:glycosyltransferase family 4 protein [Lachnospiraceae bacterium]
MKILMLVNWKIEYASEPQKDKQPPDYYVKGEPYWFFRYFKDKDVEVDVADVSSTPRLEDFEKNKIRFYVRQTIKALPDLDDYDMVISHGMQSGIVLALWRKLFGKGSYKHVVFDIGAFNSAKESGKALKFMRFAGRSIDGIIYHTPSQIDYYRKCHPWLVRKAVYIPFGTDTEFFDETAGAENSGETGQGAGSASSEKRGYILSAGYSKRDRNTLVEAYEKSQKKIPLRIIGDEELAEKIRLKYRDYDNETMEHCLNRLNIEVLGGVPVNEFKEQIINAAFCVLPLKSFNYSYGQMTMLQQMAMGKAVIAADIPALKPYLREGANLKYEPENTEELTGLIDELSNDPGRCDKIGKNAKELVKKEFNEKIMAEKIEEALKFFMDFGG